MPIDGFEVVSSEVPFVHQENVVVYLVQNRELKKEKSFGLPRENFKNRMDLFFISLNYLLLHVPPKERFDIHIYHEGDLSEEQLFKIQNLKTERFPIYLNHIHFTTPPWLDEEEIKKDIEENEDPAWRTLGYRHMCRFYSLLIYDRLIELGYKKMSRLDDDSWILSKITEMFQLVNPDKPYICRLILDENPNYAKHMDTFIQEYFDSSFDFDKTIENIPFNNFFILDLSLYQQKPILDYLKTVDYNGGIYKHRWGDALVQGNLLKIFNIPYFILPFPYSKWGVVYEPSQVLLFPRENGNNNIETLIENYIPPTIYNYPTVDVVLIIIFVILMIPVLICFFKKN